MPSIFGLDLPVVKTLEDSANFALTVTPYIPQLKELPQRLLENVSSLDNLKDVYLSTNPLIFAFAFSLFLAPIFLIVSEVNKNYSQVDRCWSILPTVYIAHYTVWAHLSGLPTTRLDNALAVAIVWSLRLTYNYWRKGGYTIGSEDYRWEVLRKHINPPLFFVFNVTFISLAQSILLFLVTTPTYVLLLSTRVTGDELDTADLVFSRTIFGLILICFFADQSQWNYQEAKKSYLKTAKVPLGFNRTDLDRGFVVSGLWSWSRHPNFAAEQAVWVALYQWGSFESNTLYNWSFVGAFAYLILFQSSTWFTEKLTAGKYPEYAEYQQRVGKFLPRLGTSIPGDSATKKDGNSGKTAGVKAIEKKKK